jgi:hypothetical protein
MPTATHEQARTGRSESSDDNFPLVVESCHSVWLFDEENRRFRRMVKGLGPDVTVATDWRPYDHLVIDEQSDAFLVFLDENGTRLLRSRRHLGDDCDRCSTERTRELSLLAIANFTKQPPAQGLTAQAS